MRRCAARGGTAAAVERAARGQIRAGVGQARQTRAAAFLSLRTAHVIAACHMTALEICYSAQNQADLEALLAGQRALEWLPVNEAVMDRALEVQRLLAAHSGNGHLRPIPDLIIAATAELHRAEVLHVDSDYDMIARVTDQPMRRLFDPGPT
jgi:predicted nucleic acid-binding protein